jgi:two-component system OmpR family response regulator
VTDLPLSVLVVDDQPELVGVIRDGLGSAGHTVEAAATGEEGLERATAQSYDVIILDVMLPGMDGFEVARKLRDRGVTTPILMLTARDQEGDVVQGLSEGADAYLPKPFRIAELEAHLNALRRRVGMEAQTVLQEDDLVLDRVKREVRRGATQIPLTNIEFKLLETLLLRPARVFSKEELLHLGWGLSSDPGTGVLNVHLGNLRGKLEADGRSRVVHTVRGRGYSITSPEAP